MRCLVHGYDGHDWDDVARQPGCVTCAASYLMHGMVATDAGHMATTTLLEAAHNGLAAEKDLGIKLRAVVRREWELQERTPRRADFADRFVAGFRLGVDTGLDAAAEAEEGA